MFSPRNLLGPLLGEFLGLVGAFLLDEVIRRANRTHYGLGVSVSFLRFFRTISIRSVTRLVGRLRMMTKAADLEPGHMLALARAGSAPALGQLLDLYRHYLTLLARLQIGRRLQSKVDASDLVQETFVQAHEHFSGFRGTTEAELMAWLRQILATTLANLVRHYSGTQRRDPRLERDLAAELEDSSRVLDRALVGKQSSPSERAVRREQAVLLANALARLPADYREVIVLRHLEGLKFADVARRMGRTVDSVKKLWTPALAELRSALGGPL
jgi:RNA polymerase sigma-70 factor, ECF subfamily